MFCGSTLGLMVAILRTCAAQTTFGSSEALVDEGKISDGESIYNLTGALRSLQGAKPGLPVEYSGSYMILGCAESGRVAELQIVIPEFQHYLRLAAAEAKLGLRSPLFRSFFKSDGINGLVAGVFERIADGAQVFYENQDSFPILLCITGLTNLLLETCRSIPATKLLHIQKWIAGLCPEYFSMRHYWDTNIACPTVRNGQFQIYQAADDEHLLDSQYAVFVAQYVLAYLPVQRIAKAKNTLEECVALSPAEALANPTTYAWFAAGMLLQCIRSNEETNSWQLCRPSAGIFQGSLGSL